MAHLLVVDDESDSLEFVGLFLQKKGHRVTTARDGQEALRLLLTERPDAVVLDVRMPQLDGIALLEVMRSYLRWHSLPVVLVTAHGTPEQLIRARDLGVVYIFDKAQYKLAELSVAIDDITETRHDTLTC
jgi:CheY-like chemotaxis protein